MIITELNHIDVLNMLPERNPWGHKGSFGKILILCGSKGFTGAAYFAAMGALRSGAGLVFLGVPESIYAIEAIKLNEPVVFPLPEKDGKLSVSALPEIDIVITMGCNVQCPSLPCKHREDWGLDDPSGKEDEAFLFTMGQIEAKVLELKRRILSGELL